jgi:hypothetical protein
VRSAQAQTAAYTQAWETLAALLRRRHGLGPEDRLDAEGHILRKAREEP